MYVGDSLHYVTHNEYFMSNVERKEHGARKDKKYCTSLCLRGKPVKLWSEKKRMAWKKEAKM